MTASNYIYVEEDDRLQEADDTEDPMATPVDNFAPSRLDQPWTRHVDDGEGEPAAGTGPEDAP